MMLEILSLWLCYLIGFLTRMSPGWQSIPRSLLKAESRADRSSSVALASHPGDVTRRELVHLNLCVVRGESAASEVGRATE